MPAVKAERFQARTLPPISLSLIKEKEMQTVHLVLSLFLQVAISCCWASRPSIATRKEKRNEDGNRLKAFPKRQTDHL